MADPKHEDSFATITNVDRPSLGEPTPEAVKRPPLALKGAVIFLLIAIVAMVVAIAFLK